jgi:ADP-L-glycero-D-manno-heptose 6-epimerase
MIIVTGGAGFIGSNLVAGLNALGERDILVVDNLLNAEKVKNLSGLDIADYMDKEEFRRLVRVGQAPEKVRALFHQGACSDTMATDGRYVLDNNFTCSKELFHYCRQHGAPFLYASSASVYGAGDRFIESPEFESTLNAYAYSKLLFDNYIRKQGDTGIQCVGLRYFNVYGPREQHKARMASVAWHFRGQYRREGKVRLFQGTAGYGDGEQRRDFVSVEDVVAVNLFLLERSSISGIFNLGTGRCQSFNDVAISVINSLRRRDGEAEISLQQAMESGIIEYIPMPAALQGKYQSYTEASLERLRDIGYDRPFLSVEEGVGRYMEVLDQEPVDA